MYPIGIEWVAAAAESLTSIAPEHHPQWNINDTVTDSTCAPAVEMDCFWCLSCFDRQVPHYSSTCLAHLKTPDSHRLKRPQPQGLHLREWMCVLESEHHSFFFLPRPLSHFYSTSFHSFSIFSGSLRSYASYSLPFSAIVYMHIYKSAHNWCLGKGKERWGREAIRGIKRGAASQPSFTGQWSKSNWVLFCSRTHTHSCTRAEMQWQWWKHTADRSASGTLQGWACLGLAR